MSDELLTTVVGSYPIPDWLAAHPSEEAWRDALATVLHIQEMIGIDVVTDGELSRFDRDHPETNGMIEYFVHPLTNVRTTFSRTEERRFREFPDMQFRTRPAGVVEGQLGEGTLHLARDYQRVRSLTKSPIKFTLTSPYMLAKAMVDRHYKTPQALMIALADVLAHQVAEIDADIVQVDEVFLVGRPEDAVWAIEPLNHIFDSIKHQAAIHLCHGNYGGQPTQSGHLGKLIDFLNQLHIDHVVLEMAVNNQAELDVFRNLRPEIKVGVGVIDIKRTVVETPDEVAQRIGQAHTVLGPGRIRYVHPDCGFWMLRRGIADAKMRALVQGRNLYLGKK
ncbi:MAG: cobalamin-independent methionine synthase II family protein [Phycisphaerae bacterium]